MFFSLSPKELTYISISLAIIVVLATLAMILFPKYINKWDKELAFEGKEQPWLLYLALFLNYAITPLTVSIFYLIMVAIFLWQKEYRIIWIGVSSIIMVSILFWSLKRITQRPRPKDAKIKFKDYSFPSWHTWAGFVFFLSFALASVWLLDIHYYERVFVLALIGWAIIAWSRWYIHVHWLSDVIIGSFLGIWCFIFSYLLFFYFGDALFNAFEQVFFSL